jgi:uroporphyrin-III C-methyltransferase/precorrin-2 dehydrogenase/sirohydrochlorin ferrochelatase
MKHFPVFLNVDQRRIVVSGGGEAALAKVRLLLKTSARIAIYSRTVSPELINLASSANIEIFSRPIGQGDASTSVLFYAANDDEAENYRVSNLARQDGALVNWVDNLDGSDFLTPAIVDRDPVTVAIGTEGAAPVLARAIKADFEERLPRSLGILARIGKTFRAAAEALPLGRRRRDFWSDFYFRSGPRAFDENGEAGLAENLDVLLGEHLDRTSDAGHVYFVGAGPGDPELLTLKARKLLHNADVVIHDRLVTKEILELARREALIVDAGKEGFGPSTDQSDINALLVKHARQGAHVVRLKSGDPTVFGRLDEEIEAVTAEDIDHTIVPGITSASAAVASISQSFTKRGRNSSVRFVTGHDLKGYAEHDWRALAVPGQVAAIYMGKKAARFLQGRLLMHGAAPDTPITVIANASRADQFTLKTNISSIAQDIENAGISGPALILLGLAPRASESISEFKLTEGIAL